MSTNQQRREAAKRKLERQRERRSQRDRRRKRNIAIVAAIIVVAVAGATVEFATRRGYDMLSDPSAAARSSTAAEPTPATTPAGVCRYVKTPESPAARPVSVPANADPAEQGTVNVVMTTNQGVLPITLERAKAPCTVESFLNLVNADFYSNTPCHRLVTTSSLKVLQCGDPTGTGTGGPGYTIPDEPPTGLAPAAGGRAAVYPRGSVAMAKTSAPNSGGSQFFLVFADSQLPPTYTIFGSVTEPGIKVLEKIATGGDDSNGEGDGKPSLATSVQTVTVAKP